MDDFTLTEESTVIFAEVNILILDFQSFIQLGL
jgi:hypothetical protein